MSLIKKLRRQLQGKRHIKIELCVKFSLCDYSLFITLYKIEGVHFRLLGTNDFHVQAKNERSTAASFRCRQNLKYENWQTPSKHGTKERAARAERLFSSFNQSNH